MSSKHASTILASTTALVLLAACSGVSVEKPERYVTDKQDKDWERYGTLHGEKGFYLFGTGGRRSDSEDAVSGGNIGVNPFLWRAALETVDFMPLAQTDPLGGVIITDWYTPPETPNERFKLTVYILDRSLRADGVNVSVFRQERTAEGWSDAPVAAGTASSIEDNILGRARELRVASVEEAGE